MHQKLRRVDRMLEAARGKKNAGEIDIERRVNRSGIVAFKERESPRKLQQPISLDRRPDPDREGAIEVEDLQAVNPIAELYQGEMKHYVWKLMEELPIRHRIVLRLRYGMDDGTEHTLESIGQRLKISRERVRQIQSEAFDRISRIAMEQDPTWIPMDRKPERPAPRRPKRRAGAKRRAATVSTRARRDHQSATRTGRRA